MVRSRWAVPALFGFFLVLFSLFFPSSSVEGISNPDGISIQSQRAFRNLAQADDQLFIIEYKVLYAIEPAEDVRVAFYGGIHDGSNFVATKPLLFYGHNFVGIYLDPTQALTWEGSYDARITGDPVLFGSIIVGLNMASVSFGADDWIDGTLETTPDNIRSHILTIMTGIEGSRGEILLAPNGLLNEAGGDMVLRLIPRINAWIPTMFGTITSFPTEPTPAFTTTYQAELRTKTGNRLTNAMEQLGETFLGSSSQGFVFGTIGILLLAVSFIGIVFNTVAVSSTTLVLSLPLLYIGVTTGVIPLALALAAFFTVAILFGISFILARGS